MADGPSRTRRLGRLLELVRWCRFEKPVARLPDAELEEALADRLSFRRFVGLS